MRLFVQSELDGFDPHCTFDLPGPWAAITPDEHALVERFLGRNCTLEEAQRRSAWYVQAEGKWARDLAPYIERDTGIVMRQVSHPDMLSFRPFPGGAIRAQNGTLGWVHQGKDLSLKLATSKIWDASTVQPIPLRLPYALEGAAAALHG